MNQSFLPAHSAVLDDRRRYHTSGGQQAATPPIGGAAIRLLVLAACCLIPAAGLAAQAASDSRVDSNRQADSNRQVAEPTYLLRYSFDADETVRYEVTHVAKTKTRISGTEELANVHTVSQKVWNLSSVDPTGEMTFVHSVDAVELTQQTGENPEIRWSSESGQAPPILFETVAEQIKTPLSTVTIDPQGGERSRQTHAGVEHNLGMGGLTIPLPAEAIPVGHRWNAPREIRARGEAGEVKVIKARDVYTLEKVQTGVATLRVRTEVLTPMETASIKAQIVQQLSNGTIRFDIDAGRCLSKQLDWDETVVGFQGPNSLMEYRARLTESLVDSPTRTARRPR